MTTGTTRIGRNTAVNIAGAAIPLAVSVLTVPVFLRQIGEVKYGLLAVVWALTGYFGVFELGLGRATANRMARLARASDSEREGAFWTAVALNLALGLAGGVALYFLGHVLVTRALRLPDALRPAALEALPWLSASVPLITLTSVLVGALEGRERFVPRNLLTTFGAVSLQLAPLACAMWISTDLSSLVAASVVPQFVTTAALLAACASIVPARRSPRIVRNEVGGLVRFGGWITVTTLVAPILTVLDRIVIGSVLGAASVARYAIPFNLVSRLLILSSSLGRVLFPRFAILDARAAGAVERRAIVTLAALTTPLAIAGMFVIEPFLHVWVGADIARDGGPVGVILLLGMWINSIAAVPYSFLQGRGRPDITAKFHLLEIIPYCLALWAGLKWFGLVGAAWAWTFRVTLDASLLFAVSRDRTTWNRSVAISAALVIVAALSSLALDLDTAGRALVGGALSTVAAGWAVVGWSSTSPQHRAPLWTRSGMVAALKQRRFVRSLARRRRVARARLEIAVAVPMFRHRAARAEDLASAIELAFAFRIGNIRTRPAQIQSELARFLVLISEQRATRVLEIGTAKGGTLFTLTRALSDDGVLISVDLPGGPFGGGYAPEAMKLFHVFPKSGQTLQLVQADSHDPATARLVSALVGGHPFDVIFIDGDHDYVGVRRDFDLYSSLVGPTGIVALHDIVPGPRDFVGGVPEYWRELRALYDHVELVEDWKQAGYGIGVVFVGRRDEGQSTRGS